MTFIFALLVVLIAYPITTYAYIDPGTGSLAYQSILGMFLGAAVFFRQIRTEIQRWRRRADTSSPSTAKKDDVER